MNMNMNTTITSTPVPEALRVDASARLFGIHFPMKMEPTIYAFASRLCDGYGGGYRHFHTLSNGGFYMAPEGESFRIACENGFEGSLSADAFGVTACLYAYSHLSFGGDAFAEVCADHYHLLREFALGHAQSASILAACD